MTHLPTEKERGNDEEHDGRWCDANEEGVRLRVDTRGGPRRSHAGSSCGSRPAKAAFPGSNGKIVFWAARSIDGSDPSTTDTEIFSMIANGMNLQQLTVNAIRRIQPRLVSRRDADSIPQRPGRERGDLRDERRRHEPAKQNLEPGARERS